VVHTMHSDGIALTDVIHTSTSFMRHTDLAKLRRLEQFISCSRIENQWWSCIVGCGEGQVLAGKLTLLPFSKPVTVSMT
jgi:hypothetical protein